MSDVKRYRKKPVAVRAIQYTGNFGTSNPEKVRDFLGDDFAGWKTEDGVVNLLIHTLEHPDNPFKVAPGWFILEGVRGEHYACEPAIFAETYEEA